MSSWQFLSLLLISNFQGFCKLFLFCVFSPLQLTYLPPPWGECESKALESGFFEVYSVTACRIDCETRYIVENCNCRMVHMPGEHRSWWFIEHAFLNRSFQQGGSVFCDIKSIEKLIDKSQYCTCLDVGIIKAPGIHKCVWEVKKKKVMFLWACFFHPRLHFKFAKKFMFKHEHWVDTSFNVHY